MLREHLITPALRLYRAVDALAPSVWIVPPSSPGVELRVASACDRHVRLYTYGARSGRATTVDWTLEGAEWCLDFKTGFIQHHVSFNGCEQSFERDVVLFRLAEPV